MKNSTNYASVKNRILSMIMTLLIIFYAIPSVVYAEVGEAVSDAVAGIGAGSPSDSVEGNSSDPYSYESVAYEVEELREENTKHFRLPDGSYLAAHYDYPVHYLDESGAYADIDNALEENGDSYENANTRIKFSKKVTGNGSLFTLKDGEAKISMSLVGAIKKTEGAVYNNSDAEEDTELQKMINLEKLSSRIVYENILDGVDLEYIADSLNVKENIIVKEKRNSYSYSFELKLNGLIATLSENGDVILIEEGTDEVRYTIPAPVVYDADGIYADKKDACYTLSDSGNGKYTLTVTVAAEWMNDGQRAFPVCIDPTIAHLQANVIDTFVSFSSLNSVYSHLDYLVASNNTQIYWKATSLPTLPSSAYITDAEFSLRCITSTDGAYVGIYSLTTDWDESLTGNMTISDNGTSIGYLDTSMIDYQYVSATGRYYWSIKPIVARWYNGYNYGLGLRRISGTSTTVRFASNNNYNPTIRPTLTISYVDMKGREDYFPSKIYDTGISGTASVNLATGQLCWSIPTLSTTDSLLSFTPTLVYNSELANKDYAYPNAQVGYSTSYTGYGFKLNICETVIEKSYTDVNGTERTYYIYSDADGTEHSFLANSTSSTVYYDEDGLQKRLTVKTNGTITITDDSNITRCFTKMSSTPDGSVSGSWYLTQINDNVGNAIIFTFDEALRPTKVSVKPNGLAQIDFLNLYYYSTGKLKMVYNPTSKDAVLLRYSETTDLVFSTTATNYLRQVVYARGSDTVTLSDWNNFIISEENDTNIVAYETVEFNTPSSGLLTIIRDLTRNSYYGISWSNNKISKITKVPGYTTLAAFSYGNGYADVQTIGCDETLRTDDDVITRYTFDERGRAKSVYSTSKDGTILYGAKSGEYETQEEVKNNIKKSLTLGGSSINYLLNGDFEESASATSFDYWDLSGAVTRTSEGYAFHEGKYSPVFKPTAGTTASVTQYVTLKKGTYTLALALSIQQAEDVIGSVNITSVGSTGFTHTENIPMNMTVTNGIQQDFSTTFTVTSASDTLKVTISFTSASSKTDTPFIYLYRAMLDKSIGASDYSLVKYGSFEESSSNSTGLSNIALSEYWTDSGNVTSVYNGTGTFGKSLKITANQFGEAYAKQRIFGNDYITYYSNGGYEFIVSGFAKSGTALLSDNGIFRLRAEVVYYNTSDGSTFSESECFDFVPSCRDWQFVSGTFSTYYESGVYAFIKEINLYCEFSGQVAGSFALFDNISVVNCYNSDIVEYAYYAEGVAKGLPAIKKNALYEECYEYDSSRNLKRVANNFGMLTEYVYNSKNQVLYSVEYSFKDELGAYDYPLGSSDPDSEITKTPRSKTTYTYNSYGLCTKTESFMVDSTLAQAAGTKKLTSTYTYNVSTGSKIFGSLSSECNSLGETTRYFYDSKDGKLLANINSNEGTGLVYTYDASGRLTEVVPATYSSESSYSPITNAESVSYTYNDRKLLEMIVTESTTYGFLYNDYLDVSAVGIPGTIFAEYDYIAPNGKLSKITYGNGFIVEYVYDRLENISEIWYTDSEGVKSLAYSYEYTSDGMLYKFTDHRSGRSTVYKYDTNNRIVGCIEYSAESDGGLYNDFSYTYSYNDKGQHDSTYQYFDYLSGGSVYTSEIGYSYSYNPDGSLKKISMSEDDTYGGATYTYDKLYRVTKKVNYHYLRSDTTQTFTNEIGYTYDETTENTSTRVKTYTSTVNDGTPTVFTYTYDGRGNITKIVYNTGAEVRYYYDDLNQLIREDNPFIYKTYVYTYDNAGNILQKKTYSLTAENVTPTTTPSTITYTYGNSAWGDQLTSYNGTAITYDAIGNPINYRKGIVFGWEGRRLVSAIVGNTTVTYTYNDEGLRTSKTVNGVTTKYYYEGSLLITEQTPTYTIMYIYDESGSPIGYKYRENSYSASTWDTFWYEKNLQGDVIAIYNNSGTKLASYRYDAWGSTYLSYYNGGASTKATVNPFRYRGYYYDTHLGLFYLGSRYYDPVVGRFISPDSYVSTGQGLIGNNMYSYCGNNPVMRVDPTGEFWMLKCIEVATITYLATALFLTCLAALVYDATHDQVLSNMVSDAVDVVVDAVDTVVESAKSITDSKAEEKEEVATDVQQYNYWTATIVDGVVTQGNPLTYSQAREWVAAENDLLCRDHASAIAIVKFFPSAIWDSAHRGGTKCGYLNHYHLSNAHKNHIWYYGE